MSAADVDDTNDGTKKVEFVSAAIWDSRRKCQDFIGMFTGAQAADNTALDVSALILSGLATVFTPANTVRSLSAASTAVQGTKQAINSDLYQQMTMLLLVQQINSTYYKQMSDEFGSFPPTGTALQNLSASAELEKIQGMHRNCSIPFAAANISASQTQQPVSGQGNSLPNYTVKLGGTVTAGDTVTLNASSASGAGFPVTISYQVVAGDSIANVMNHLISEIYRNPALAQADVSATRVNVPGAGTTAQFNIGGGPTDIQWSKNVSGSATETVSIVAVKTSS